MPFGSCPMMIGDFDRTRTEEATGCMQFLADTLGFSDSTEQELTIDPKYVLTSHWSSCKILKQNYRERLTNKSHSSSKCEFKVHIILRL